MLKEQQSKKLVIVVRGTSTYDNYRDLTTGRIGRKLVRFALPVIAANLLQALYNLADMAIVGHYDMARGMSSVNLGGTVTHVIFVIAMALSNTGSVLIGQLWGAKRQEDAARAAGTILTFLGAVALALTAATLIFRVPLLRAMNTPDTAFPGALSYLTICAAGTVVVYLYNANSAILRAAGESTQPLIAVTLCAVMNIALDLVLVGGFRLGPAGAAYATVFSQLCSAVLTGVFVKRLGLRWFKGDFSRIDRDLLHSLLKIALPNCIQQVLVSLSFACVSSLINQFGTVASAAAGAVSKLGAFAQLPPQAVMSSLMALTAQNLGAGKISNVRQGLRAGAYVGIGLTLLICCVIWAIPDPLIALMTPDTAVAEAGAAFFRWVALSYVFESILFVLYGVLIGAGYTNVTLLCGIMSSLVLRYTLAWLITRFTAWGFPGIGAAYAAAPFGAVIIALSFYLSGHWKTPRVKV